MRRAAIALLLVFASCRSSDAQLDELIKQLPQFPGSSGQTGSMPSSVGQVKIGQALKQALQVGTENAVKLTGRTDGYFRNEAIKILVPERLKTLESGLRMLGYGQQMDELVLGMNRAAEHAAPAAKEIFFDAIGEMTIDDARKILDGAPTAATDYFKGKTTGRLTTAFTPIVEKSMSQVGVTRQYNELLAQARALPFVNVEQFDLDKYVVGKSLDGLFVVVGEEEKKIRTNPQARVTDLLRDVFGNRR